MAGKGKPLKGVGTAGPYSGDMKKKWKNLLRRYLF